MIKANFNTYSSYVTDSLHQWDLNQILTVSGLNLATAPEVHFSNANTDKAIVRQSTMTDHIVSVQIPNSLLQQPLTIKAHIGIYEGDTFKVVELIEIPIIPKARPIDYSIEDSDEEIYSFKALENAIANMATQKQLSNVEARVSNIIANANTTEGNSELVDNRIGYDSKTYESSGDAIRSQNEDIVNTLIRSGIYSEKVINGTDVQGVYIYKSSGAVAEAQNSDRAYIVYDISEYVGKSVIIQSKIISDSMINYVFEDVENKIISGYSVGIHNLKEVVRIPDNANKLYVNYCISAVANSNVLVKVIDTVNVSEILQKSNENVKSTNDRLDVFANDGLLLVNQSWEFGGISTSGQIYSPDDYRIRTIEYYHSSFDTLYYNIVEGYRLLIIFYERDKITGEYVYKRHKGYVTGSGEISINEGEYILFTLRGVTDSTFIGDEYKYLTLYHKPEAFITKADAEDIVKEYDPYTIPDYWLDTIKAKETEIKNIVYDGVKNDNDIALFFATADNHYPVNNYTSTTLARYLGQKCGVGLTLCLGDLITDSTVSRDEGIDRIKDGITQLQTMSDRMILTQGNHDINCQITESDGTLSIHRMIYDKEWILHTSNRLLTLNGVVFDELSKAFYYDDQVLKIRFISLDSFEDKTFTITDDKLTGCNLGDITDRQITWFKNVALKNIPSGYSVITFSHLGLYSPIVSNGSEFISLDGFGRAGGGDKIIEAIKQFKTDGGDFIGHFAGHLHHDFVSVKDGVIGVHLLNDGTHYRKADYFGKYADLVGDSPLKVVDTVNECAFDVVIVNKTTRHVDLIRIGAGNNRQFDY